MGRGGGKENWGIRNCNYKSRKFKKKIMWSPDTSATLQAEPGAAGVLARSHHSLFSENISKFTKVMNFDKKLTVYNGRRAIAKGNRHTGPPPLVSGRTYPYRPGYCTLGFPLAPHCKNLDCYSGIRVFCKIQGKMSLKIWKSWNFQFFLRKNRRKKMLKKGKVWRFFVWISGENVGKNYLIGKLRIPIFSKKWGIQNSSIFFLKKIWRIFFNFLKMFHC